MVDYKAIGRRIAFYRKKAALTQAVLSEKLGVTESYISQIERGSAKASLSRLDQIASVLSVDIALLISDHASVSHIPVNSEVFEIIKDWPTEQISFLIDLLTVANDKLVKPKK